ncbi:TetR/AcrR family transcriptional regulator [Pyruvatibacter sp.]|uniref:TetR/AcrR family transcriptional regulator n=1 Tax=Pyruvatibacter sp. TaxID=1981328 RepID=UPI0032EB74AB
MPKIVDHDARRAELVEASWQVIATQGLEGVTMRRVADAAGCTTGRITHYFADREALVLAALRAVNDAAGDRTAQIIKSDLSARDKLMKCLEEGLPLDATRLLEFKVWIAFWSAAASTRQLARENDARHTAWISAMKPLINAVAPNADAEHHAHTLMGLLDGLGLTAAINPTQRNRQNAKRAVHRYVDNMMRADA